MKTMLRSIQVLVLGFGCASLQAADDSGPAMPLRLPPEAQPFVREVQGRIYQAAEKQAHYLLGTVHPWAEDGQLRLLTESKSGEHWIRPNSGAIEGLAFLCRFGPYDDQVVGVSRRQLLNETVVPMMRYLVATHVTGSRTTSEQKPWGDAWQSAHWTQMLGRGAWFVWEDLPADLRAGVRKVVAHEADRIANSEPPHQLRLDTKAEENAWNSQVFSVAMLLMPEDPRRGRWEKAFQKWVMSSFLRPADEHNETLVDGRPVREQFTGANILDDFTLENHNFVHPDYMMTFSSSVGCAPDFALTGRRMPDALLFNVSSIYDNLKWMLLPEGGLVYPNGQDWELFRNPSWLSKHVLMAVWAQDPDAWRWVQSALNTLAKMQARSTEGAVFHSAEYFFPSTQTDLLRSLANAWLSLQLTGRITDAPRERIGVRRWDSAKVILHGTPDAIHTVSWGARIMAQCVPRRLDRLVSPDARNGFGHVILAGERSALPLRLETAEVRQGTNWFETRLTADHGQAFRAHLTFRSQADGSFVMAEKLVSLTNTTTAEISTGLVGILNNPHWIYERGRRRVTVDGRSTDVPANSGREWNWENVSKVNVDDILLITSARSLRVHYLAASKAERGRVTDRLVLNHLPGNRTFTASEVVSDFEVVMRCTAAKP